MIDVDQLDEYSIYIKAGLDHVEDEAYNVNEWVTLQELRDLVEGSDDGSDSDESDSDGSSSGESEDEESDDDGPSYQSEGCHFVGYEENECGRREWCEETCVLSGGMWEGPYETDRATMKESCTVWDADDNETLCDFRKMSYMGYDMGCD